MSIVPPAMRHPSRSATAPLDYEIAQEKAAALGRLGRGLEAALAALAAFVAADPSTQGRHETNAARTELVAAAGHALWLFLVQRDACGLRDARAVMRDYGVPAEVQNCAGAFPPQRDPRGAR